MRRKSEKRTIGDTRIISKFLLCPTTIDGETRWLEKAKIKQTAVFDTGDTHFGYGYVPTPKGLTLKYKWKNTKWVD